MTEERQWKRQLLEAIDLDKLGETFDSAIAYFQERKEHYKDKEKVTIFVHKYHTVDGENQELSIECLRPETDVEKETRLLIEERGRVYREEEDRKTWLKLCEKFGNKVEKV